MAKYWWYRKTNVPIVFSVLDLYRKQGKITWFFSLHGVINVLNGRRCPWTRMTWRITIYASSKVDAVHLYTLTGPIIYCHVALFTSLPYVDIFPSLPSLSTLVNAQCSWRLSAVIKVCKAVTGGEPRPPPLPRGGSRKSFPPLPFLSLTPRDPIRYQVMPRGMWPLTNLYMASHIYHIAQNALLNESNPTPAPRHILWSHRFSSLDNDALTRMQIPGYH